MTSPVSLTHEIRSDLSAEASRRREAMQAVGCSTSRLWLSLELPACDACGERFEHSELIAHKHCGLGWRRYCAECNSPGYGAGAVDGEERDRKRAEYNAVMGW